MVPSVPGQCGPLSPSEPDILAHFSDRGPPPVVAQSPGASVKIRLQRPAAGRTNNAIGYISAGDFFFVQALPLAAHTLPSAIIASLSF